MLRSATRSAGRPAPAARARPRGLTCRACTHCSSESGAAEAAPAATAPQHAPEQANRAALASALGVAAAHLAVLAQAAVASEAPVPIVPVNPSTYVPSPMEPSWQVWFGAIIGVVPFAIGAYEFTKRILIQRRCKVCGGRGLVLRGKYLKKCPECGGMFPWISWRMFLSANARPGNGGPLMQPRGQTSVFYTVPPPRDAPPAAGGLGHGRAAAAEGGDAAAGAEAQREAVAAQQQLPPPPPQQQQQQKQQRGG